MAGLVAPEGSGYVYWCHRARTRGFISKNFSIIESPEFKGFPKRSKGYRQTLTLSQLSSLKTNTMYMGADHVSKRGATWGEKKPRCQS